MSLRAESVSVAGVDFHDFSTACLAQLPRLGHLKGLITEYHYRLVRDRVFVNFPRSGIPLQPPEKIFKLNINLL